MFGKVFSCSTKHIELQGNSAVGGMGIKLAIRLSCCMVSSLSLRAKRGNLSFESDGS